MFHNIRAGIVVGMDSRRLADTLAVGVRGSLRVHIGLRGSGINVGIEREYSRGAVWLSTGTRAVLKVAHCARLAVSEDFGLYQSQRSVSDATATVDSTGLLLRELCRQSSGELARSKWTLAQRGLLRRNIKALLQVQDPVENILGGQHNYLLGWYPVALPDSRRRFL